MTSRSGSGMVGQAGMGTVHGVQPRSQSVSTLDGMHRELQKPGLSGIAARPGAARLPG